MKNSRYFRHDWGARNDPKILRLVRVKGAEAKAIYWDLVEMLYEEGGMLPIDVIEDVAFVNHVPSETARFVVLDSGLFSYDKTHFWSERQQRDEVKIKEISEARQNAGRAGGKASGQQRRSKNEANANQTGIKDEAINKIKEKDIYISSPKGSDMPPTFTELETQGDSVFSDNLPLVEKKLTDAQCKEIIQWWNNIVKRTGATFSTVTAFSEERKNQIRIRWKEFEKLGEPFQVCRTIFEKACASNFLQGEGSKGWRANFDWIFRNGKNWPKIYEGAYDNKTPQQSPGGFTERTISGLQEIHDFFNPDNNGTDNSNNSIPDDQIQW